MLSCPAHNFFYFDISLPYLTHGCIIMKRSVAHIHYPVTTFDLWPQDQIYRIFYYMDLCLGHSFFVLWHSHTMFGTWVYMYHHGTMCDVHSWHLYDLDLWPQYQNYIFTMNLSLASSSLFFNVGIAIFGISVYVPSCTLYDLDLWPICGWRGYPQWV